MRIGRKKIKKSKRKVIANQSNSYILFSETDIVRAMLFDGSEHLIKTLGKYQFGVFSPDDNYIATLTKEGKATLFTAQGRILRHFSERRSILNIAFSKDSQQLLINTKPRNKDFNIKWSLSGEILSDLNHQMPLIYARFSMDDQYVLSGNKGDIVTLWKIENQKTTKVKDIQHCIENIPLQDKNWFNTTLSLLSPNNQYFLTWRSLTNERGLIPGFSSTERLSTVKIWNTEGIEIGEIPQTTQIVDKS